MPFILADVLEHLRDPWKTLRSILYYVKTGGISIVSVPNIRELRTIGGILLHGTFEYQKSGILDKTHLRFFCKRDITRLIDESGMKIDSIKFELSPKRRLFNRFTVRIFEDFLVRQYVIRSKKIVHLPNVGIVS